MSEQNSPTAPSFAVQRIFVKDSSFESPNSPAIFKQTWKPEIKLDMNTRAQKLEESLVEVTLMLTVKASMDDKTAFIAEVHQSGIFQIDGFEDEQRGHMLGAYCPNMLFPYARQHLDMLVTQGSFPPVMLAPINFDAVYQQAMQEKTKNAEEKKAEH